jgi:hypothetical protein
LVKYRISCSYYKYTTLILYVKIDPMPHIAPSQAQRTLAMPSIPKDQGIPILNAPLQPNNNTSIPTLKILSCAQIITSTSGHKRFLLHVRLHTNTTSGTKNATHHTLSLDLTLRPPAAPAALGAGGMLVPCAFVDALRVAVVLSVERVDMRLAGEEGLGNDVAPVDIEAGACDDGSMLGDAEASDDAIEGSDEAAVAMDDSALEAAGTAGDNALDAADGAPEEVGMDGVVAAEVAEAGAEGPAAELGSGERTNDGTTDD